MMDTIRPLPVISTVQVVNKLFEGDSSSAKKNKLK
jgi:hypothetical protein